MAQILPTLYSFKAKVWFYAGPAAWHFVTLPKKLSSQIKSRFAPFARGWGSQRVEVKIGATTWMTSIFPDKKRGAYLLPIKKEILVKERLSPGSHVCCILQVKIKGV